MPTLKEIESAVHDALFGNDPVDRTAAKIADTIYDGVVKKLATPDEAVISRPVVNVTRADRRVSDHVVLKYDKNAYMFNIAIVVRGKPAGITLTLHPPFEAASPPDGCWRLRCAANGICNWPQWPSEVEDTTYEAITTLLQKSAIRVLKP